MPDEVTTCAHAGWATPEALAESVGIELPPTPWRPVTPETVRRFARLTGDDQGLHGAGGDAPDPPVVQGSLLLALAAGILHDLYRLPWAGTMVQAGYDSIRLRTPVRAGQRVRLRARPRRFRALGGGRYWLETAVRLECDAAARPVLSGNFLAMITGGRRDER